MAVHLSFLLILTGLTGIHSITTVSKVSVKAGDSISIPCLYDSQYRNHVKYLCKGFSWNSCTYAVKTNRPDSSGRFSISDDKIQRIFTVTVNDLTGEDTDYWCAVEINGWSDVGEYFHLSRDKPSLTVDHQEITGVKGDNITINCNGSNPGKMRWCRLGSSCVTTRSSGSIDGTRVTINASGRNVSTVTMSGLRTESSGWYQCVTGDLQMPVHVTVTEPSTTNNTSTTGQGQASVSVSLIIPLSFLICVVMVTLLIWFMFKRHKRTKAESSATAMAEEEVTYCSVKHIEKTSDERSGAQSDADVMYNSVVTVERQTVQRVEVNDEDVTYSTLAPQQQNL